MTNDQSFKGPFLFVNKDANTINTRTTEESFAIGSHVSGKYFKWSRQAKLQKLQNTVLPLNTSRGEQADASQSRSRESPHAKKTEVRETSAQTKNNTVLVYRWNAGPYARRKITINPTGSDPESNESVSSSAISQSTNENSQNSTQLIRVSNLNPANARVAIAKLFSPSPLSLLRKGNSDPFSAAATAITPRYNELINGWKGVFLQTVWPVEANPESHEGALAAWKLDSHDLISNETRLQAVLCWAILLQRTPLPESSDARRQMYLEALASKTKCLQLLRQDLKEKPPPDKMVLVVWHLMGAAFYEADIDSVVAHMNGMKSVVDSLGGFFKLHWSTQRLVIAADMTISQGLMRRPLFPVEEWDPGSITSTFTSFEAELFSLAPHIIEPLHPEIPREAINIFKEYRELLAVNELAGIVSDPQRRTELLCWSLLRQYALTEKLTNSRIDLAEAATIGEPVGSIKARALEDCLYVAIDYFLQILWNSLHPSRTAYIPFHHPQAGLESFLSDNSISHPNISLWVLFIAATVEEIISRRAQVERWNYGKFMTLAQTLGLWSAPEVRVVLTQFLYHAKSMDQHLNALLARRDQSMETLFAT